MRRRRSSSSRASAPILNSRIDIRLITHGLYLRRGPRREFGSFLVPGLFLLLVSGVGQLVAAALAVVRHTLAPWLMGALGVGLLIWNAVQVPIIPLSFLQPVLFIIGLVEGLAAFF